MPTPWLNDRLAPLADDVLNAAGPFASRGAQIVGVWIEQPAQIDLLAVIDEDQPPRRLRSHAASEKHAALVAACEHLGTAAVDGLPLLPRSLLNWARNRRGASLRVYARPAKQEVALALHGGGKVAKLVQRAIGNNISGEILKSTQSGEVELR